MSRTVAESAARAAVRQVLPATVQRRERLSPSFARLTLAGPALAYYAHHSFDQWFRLFLPRPGADQLALPNTPQPTEWYSRFLAAPEPERPWMRYVTVSDHRQPGSAACELDVEVVIHGGPGDAAAGPLSSWAQTAAEGSPVALLDQGPLFKAEVATAPTAAGLLIIGDETAVPGIAGVLKALPVDAVGKVYLEVPESDDIRALVAPGGVEVSWYARHGGEPHAASAAEAVSEASASLPAGAPGRLAFNAALPSLRDRSRDSARPYVYAAGESKMIAALNSLLRDELKWPKDLVTTVGYWHHAG